MTALNEIGWKGQVALLRALLLGSLCGLSLAADQKAVFLPDVAKGPEKSPVTILVFSDFQCPFCERIKPVMDELLRLYPGKIRLVFKHLPLSIHPKAPLAHEAALAAAEQGKFWEMHDLIFENQQRMEPEDLSGHAKRLGLEMKAFQQALQSRRLKPWVDRDVTEAQGFGVSSTPVVLINGEKLVGARPLEHYTRIVDDELGLTKPLPETSARPEIRLTGVPVKGSPSAPVTIVEFSDLECAFCGRALPVVEELLRDYPGQIRLAFKHFPLDFHANARLAHQAALAAGEQGRFWEMHDAIFANQQNMKREDFMRHANLLGLDMPRFIAALDSEAAKTAVDADRQEGARLGVSGTPTFFINGRRLVGAQPAAEFKKIIEEELQNASKQKQAESH
jgi:protein-disulfide isomerase